MAITREQWERRPPRQNETWNPLLRDPDIHTKIALLAGCFGFSWDRVSQMTGYTHQELACLVADIEAKALAVGRKAPDYPAEGRDDMDGLDEEQRVVASAVRKQRALQPHYAMAEMSVLRGLQDWMDNTLPVNKTPKNLRDIAETIKALSDGNAVSPEKAMRITAMVADVTPTPPSPLAAIEELIRQHAEGL